MERKREWRERENGEKEGMEKKRIWKQRQNSDGERE